MSEEFRRRPHELHGLRGEPPAHIMLASYSQRIFNAGDVFVPQPSPGLCVIATQKNGYGNVVLSVWQFQRSFPWTEGMAFDLLDNIDGNIRAVFVCGVLRIDENGSFPHAPHDIQQLWHQAEASYFPRNGYFGEEVQNCLRTMLLSNATQSFGYWRQNQWQQQQDWQHQVLQQVPVLQQLPTTVPLRQPTIPVPQTSVATNPRKRRRTNGRIRKSVGVRKRRKAEKDESSREESPSTPESPRSCQGDSVFG